MLSRYLFLHFFVLALAAEPIALRNLSVLNTAEDEFAPSVTADGKTLVFNARRGGRYQDIFISYLKEGNWTEPEALAPLNSAFNDETPFISPDGKTIFFASDRDGSFELPADEKGQIRVSFDLYWSHREENTWSTPEKVPGGVNTPAHERSPTIQRSTGRLFFSRWPFGEFGQARLLVATFTPQGYGKLQEIPLPISAGEQIHALIPGKDQTFFFTARLKGSRGWDVYRASLEGLKFSQLELLAPGINTDADEMYFSIADHRLFLCSNRSGGKGRFDIYTYGLEEQFAPLSQNKGFTTQAIQFDFDQASIRPESTGILDDLTAYLKENNKINLKIIGHTDLSGRQEYNLNLSLKRAQAVRDYLAARGLDTERFQVEGAGEGRPLVPGNTPEANARNRRTEFQVLP
ncbi:MAG: OmpA family protein [Spirochaetales bacterium]|nr:OmpA family protein [Spirochaetales bacterium]